MSAYVTAAMAQKATLDELDDLLVQLLAETGGPLTTAEIRSADAALAGGARITRRRSKKG
jgi:hypothetical protein